MSRHQSHLDRGLHLRSGRHATSETTGCAGKADEAFCEVLDLIFRWLGLKSRRLACCEAFRSSRNLVRDQVARLRLLVRLKIDILPIIRYGDSSDQPLMTGLTARADFRDVNMKHESRMKLRSAHPRGALAWPGQRRCQPCRYSCSRYRRAIQLYSRNRNALQTL